MSREVYVQLVDVGVEDLVHEADGRRLERILVRELDVDLPHATSEGGCSETAHGGDAFSSAVVAEIEHGTTDVLSAGP